MGRKTVSISIRPDTLAVLDKVAKDLDMNRSRLVEMLVLALRSKKEGSK